MDPAGAQIPGPGLWAGPATRDGGGDPDCPPTHENDGMSGRCLQGPFSALRNSYAMKNINIMLDMKLVKISSRNSF